MHIVDRRTSGICELWLAAFANPGKHTGSPIQTEVGWRPGQVLEPLRLSGARRRWPLERAYQYCEQFLRERRADLVWACHLVPLEIRPHLCALYSFVSATCDFVDQEHYEGRRIAALDAWEEELHRCFYGEAEHPIFVALQGAMDKLVLPAPPLGDLVKGFRRQAVALRFTTYDSLRGYTSQSADSLGRLLLAILGYQTPQLVRFADEISTALKLACLWRDIASDAARDRVYVPAEDLYFFGVGEADLKAPRATRGFRDLLRFEVARTRALFERGRPLLSRMGEYCLDMTAIWQFGISILDEIEAADFDVLAHRTPGVGKTSAMLWPEPPLRKFDNSPICQLRAQPTSLCRGMEGGA